MSYEDELIRRLQKESAGVRSASARRSHLIKMSVAGGLCALCLGLFAFQVLGGDRGRAEIARIRSEKLAGRPADPQKAFKALALSSGPQMLALAVGGAAGVWFLFLLMRLRRFD